MTASNNGSAKNGKGGKSFAVLTDSLREVCPGDKLSELESLVKEYKGDEERIRQKIAEWWDQGERAPASEEQWEDVNKKHGKKKEFVPHTYRGRGRGGGDGRGMGGGGREGRGRGGFRGGDGGGRGGGRGRSSSGRGGGRGRLQSREKGAQVTASVTDGSGDFDENHNLNDLDSHPPPPGGIPANVRVPQGAWGKHQTTPATPATADTTTTASEIIDEIPVEPPFSSIDENPGPEPIIAPLVSQPPVGVTAPKKPVSRPTPTTGNVWATRGSAHLIRAEKPKPPPVHAPVSAPITRSAPPAAVVGNLTLPTTLSSPLMHVQSDPDADLEPELAVPVTQLQDVLPPQVLPVPAPVTPHVEDEPPAPAQSLESSVWGSGPPTSAPVTSQATLQEELPTESSIAPSPLHTQPIGAPVVEPQGTSTASHAPSQPRATNSVQPKHQSRAPPLSVLNMGHWETDGDDKNIDFGFGAFGVDAEPVNMEASTSNSSANNVSQTAQKETAPPAAAPSPARPPPGLSIGGSMRPIPADAVLVHELENKLEEVSASQHVVSEPSSGSLPSQQSDSLAPQEGNSVHTSHTDVVGPSPVAESSAPIHQAPVYSPPVTSDSMGMYTYGGVHAGGGTAFIGGMPAATGLGTPLPPKPPMGVGVPLVPTQPQQHQSLYGAGPSTQQPHLSANASATGTSAPNSSNNAPSTTPGLPPGMPGMPYSPALFYGQQPHMGQYQGQIGYNYGYGGQFGGAVQGGFGYPPSMGGGYGGAPHYDDQSGSHQGTSGYQKNTGGYRSRGNHHTNANQYQTQYNPQQHGGYGGQPYGAMGYHGDFSRGGYGQPGGMQDHYIPQQQQPQAPQIGGFQSDVDQYKGKKGGPRGGYQQFQPGPPPHLNQQPFGLQGTPSGGTSSDSNNHSGPGSSGNGSGASGAGGWSNQTSGGSGWGGGAPSWQGK